MGNGSNYAPINPLGMFLEAYPFVGTEWIWLLIVIVVWLAWHVSTSAKETQEYEELASRGKGPNDHKNNITNW